MIAAALLLAAAGGVFDGSCSGSGAEPGLAAIGDVVNAFAPDEVVYGDAASEGALSWEEKQRRESAIRKADPLDVRWGGDQIDSGRCAAIVLKSVMTYWAQQDSARNKSANLDDIVRVAREKGWTTDGAMTGEQMRGVAALYGYKADSSFGARSYDSIAASVRNKTPLIVGVTGKRGNDPDLKQYGAHVIVLTGVQEVDGEKYVIGYDPNFPDGKRAWRYSDLAAAWNETITITPG